jgi:antirestriction protein ArdC
LEKNKDYEKLTPEQKQIIDMVMANLENGTGLWKQGWMSNAPESAVTKKKYRGSNNMLLMLVAMMRGYDDNRWVTYKQMEENGWSFKTDENGKSLGKGAGVNVEFYSLRDRETKKPFDRSVLDGMTKEEQDTYMKDNVYPLRRTYRVFNGSIIDGIPEKTSLNIDPLTRVERADNFLKNWSENEAKIIHGGNDAYYSINADEIHLPKVSNFLSMQEYYSTALHEVGHSTGHKDRLNRDIANKFGTPEYATEELRAEIASMFLGQEFGVTADENSVRNNSAYINTWKEKISENPNVLFTAIADADRIQRYVVAKEQDYNKKKKQEYYAIKQDTNQYDEVVHKAYMIGEYGQVRQILGYAFLSKDDLMKEFDVMRGLPFWADKEFVEITFDELQAKSIELDKEKQIQEEKSDVYIRPTEVARSVSPYRTVDMTGRGVESLTRMSDRDVIERAMKTSKKEKFNQLYNGVAVLDGEEKNEYSLMTRLAMFCDGDKERLMRVFKSSGQYRDEKPNSFYEQMADKSFKFLDSLKRQESQPIISGQKFAAGKNFKS